MTNMNEGTGHGGRQIKLTFISENPKCLGEEYNVIVELPENEDDDEAPIRVFMEDDYFEITGTLSEGQKEQVLKAVGFFLLEHPKRINLIN